MARATQDKPRLRPVVNAVFALPFVVRYQARSSSPFILRTRLARYVFYPLSDGVAPGTAGPESGVAGYNRRTRTAVWLSSRLGVEFRWPVASGPDPNAATERATFLARSLLSLTRWRTGQTQIDPAAISRPEFVQFFDANKISNLNDPLGRHVTMFVGDPSGGNTILGEAIAVITATMAPIWDSSISAAQRSVLRSDLNARRTPPLWEDYISSAIGSSSMERKVMDAGIATEAFIDQRIEALRPGYRPPANSGRRKGTIELLYRDALIAIKGRDIASELPSDYENIRYLFKARNSVAHEGTAAFTDDRGNRQLVERALFATLIASLRKCITWVESL